MCHTYVTIQHRVVHTVGAAILVCCCSVLTGSTRADVSRSVLLPDPCFTSLLTVMQHAIHLMLAAAKWPHPNHCCGALKRRICTSPLTEWFTTIMQPKKDALLYCSVVINSVGVPMLHNAVQAARLQLSCMLLGHSSGKHHMCTHACKR
jgi:hypothetical protein